MRRYETRSTMMTSNRPLEDWGKLIGDVPSATAILDRFLHHAEIIAITGKSYRLRNQNAPPAEAARRHSKPANLPTGSTARRKGQSPRPQIQRRGSRRLANRNTFSDYSTSSPRLVQPADAWPDLTCRLTAHPVLPVCALPKDRFPVGWATVACIVARHGWLIANS